jgi:hypothetical protein
VLSSRVHVQYIDFSREELQHLAQVVTTFGRISLSQLANEATVLLRCAISLHGHNTGTRAAMVCSDPGSGM